MNESKISDLRHTSLGHCLLILLSAALLGEVVGADEPVISVGVAGALIGWVAGVGVAHILLLAVRWR